MIHQYLFNISNVVLKFGPSKCIDLNPFLFEPDHLGLFASWVFFIQVPIFIDHSMIVGA